MAKITCENCGTIYQYGVVKDMATCPVCGENLWKDEETEDMEDSNIQEEAEEGLMYFDEIATSYTVRPEHNGVRAYCKECGEGNSLDLNKFDKLVDEEYVILKEGIKVTCRGCGKEHKPRKILYQEKESYEPPLPSCPVCHSFMLKKIKAGSKIIAAATLGSFALPYNSKTYECKDCGYRF